MSRLTLLLQTYIAVFCLLCGRRVTLFDTWYGGPQSTKPRSLLRCTTLCGMMLRDCGMGVFAKNRVHRDIVAELQVLACHWIASGVVQYVAPSDTRWADPLGTAQYLIVVLCRAIMSPIFSTPSSQNGHNYAEVGSDTAKPQALHTLPKTLPLVHCLTTDVMWWPAW